MLDKFIQYINTHQLVNNNQIVLLGVSGGVDSVVLLHLLHEAGIKYSIAHCNFSLRGSESDEDEEFVRQLAGNYGAPIFSKRFDTEKFAESNGMSTQVAARELRYNWFQNIIEDNSLDLIATAHHASDQVETVLYHLTKGTGISGLRGIPRQNENIIRPMLFATRQEIVTYAIVNNLKWREDSSNKSTKYNRNLIRHKVIPELKKINPGFEQTMLRNIGRFEALESFIQQQARLIEQNYMTEESGSTVLLTEWMEGNKNDSVILSEIFMNYGFNYAQILEISDLQTKQSGSEFFSHTHKILVDRDKYIISPNSATEEVEIEVGSIKSGISIQNTKFNFQLLPSSDFQIDTDKKSACLDYDKLKLPFKIRNWKQGDKFYPLGMKSQKKLSDFMIDEKIPLNLKRRQLVLESEDSIVWVVGHRIDNRFKITNDTKQILKIDISDA